MVDLDACYEGESQSGRDPSREQYVKSATGSRLFGLGEMTWNSPDRIMFAKVVTLTGSSNTMSSYIPS